MSSTTAADENAWPVKAQAVGGRHYRGNYVDQNFDSYSVEYTFADGAKFFMDGRCMTGCDDLYCSFAQGSKGMAIVSKNGAVECPPPLNKGQNPQRSNLIWESKVDRDQQDPYENEWNDLVDAIRNDKPYNEVKRGVEASLVTSMGRMAAHTGQVITFDDMLNCEHEMAPGVDKLTMDSPPPVKSGFRRQVIPSPHLASKKHREYPA